MAGKNSLDKVHWRAIILIAIGVLFLMGNFNLLPSDLWNYWPVILIVGGLAMLFKKR